jgi:hypothetical protein
VKKVRFYVPYASLSSPAETGTRATEDSHAISRKNLETGTVTVVS